MMEICKEEAVSLEVEPFLASEDAKFERTINCFQTKLSSMEKKKDKKIIWTYFDNSQLQS
jgi:hypothetical protein